MRGLEVGTALQWLALVAFTGLAVACVVEMASRRREAFGPAVALLVVALNHAAYYVAFLVFPDWLGGEATMLWSIVLRLHVVGTALVALWMGRRRP